VKQLLPILGVAVLAGFLTREFFPKHVREEVPVPHIVVVKDTVHDTLRLERVTQGPKVVTTDTVQLIIRQTLHDTITIRLGPTPEERTNVWPILALEVGRKRGDTTTVTTFSLRTAQGSIAKAWTPGPLKGIWADSTPTPRLDFWPPPEPYRVSLWTKVKWSAFGFGACTVTNGITNLLH
jgi:hypothetical protein